MKKKNFINIGKAVINLEIKALNKLKNSINNSFNLAVEQIVKCQSKVILCGVGKSGLIANKIAATFSLLLGLIPIFFSPVELLVKCEERKLCSFKSFERSYCDLVKKYFYLRHGYLMKRFII